MATAHEGVRPASGSRVVGLSCCQSRGPFAFNGSWTRQSLLLQHNTKNCNAAFASGYGGPSRGAHEDESTFWLPASSRDAHAHLRTAPRARATAAPAVTTSSAPGPSPHPATPAAAPPAPVPAAAPPVSTPSPPSPDAWRSHLHLRPTVTCRPPPRLLGFSDELYESVLRPAVEAAEAQWVAGGDAGVFRRHRALQLEARRQERHQRMRARHQGRGRGRGQGQAQGPWQHQDHWEGQGQQHGQQAQQQGQEGQPAVDQTRRPHPQPHPQPHNGSAGTGTGTGGHLPPPPPPPLQDGRPHYHIPAEVPPTAPHTGTALARGGRISGATAAPASSTGHGGVSAVGPHMPHPLAASFSTSSITTTATVTTYPSPSHSHSHSHSISNRHRQQQQQQHQQHTPHLQDTPEGGELLQKLRLVLSYEYDMPLEDVRPDLNLGQLRRPAPAPAAGAGSAAGDVAGDDDSRQQVVADCVEAAFEVFLQLGGDWAALTVAQLAAAVRGRLEQEWG